MTYTQSALKFGCWCPNTFPSTTLAGAGVICKHSHKSILTYSKWAAICIYACNTRMLIRPQTQAEQSNFTPTFFRFKPRTFLLLTTAPPYRSKKRQKGWGGWFFLKAFWCLSWPGWIKHASRSQFPFTNTAFLSTPQPEQVQSCSLRDFDFHSVEKWYGTRERQAHAHFQHFIRK